MKHSLISLLALAVLPLASFAAPSAPIVASPASFGGTAIPGGSQSTSYVISQSGSYYLAGDRVVTANVAGIVVNAPDVTIDLNGCTLRYAAGVTAAVNGIDIPAVSNVEIRNGSINDVPGDAIHAVGGSTLRVIGLRITTAGKFGVWSTAAHTWVDRSDVSYCGKFGVYVFSAIASKVTHTRAAYNGECGITLAAVKNGEISHCQATQNKRSGFTVNSPGCLVADNLAHMNNTGKTAGEGGILAGEATVVRGNVVTQNWLTGIYILYSGTVVEGNSILSTIDANGLLQGYSINANGLFSSLYLNNRISASNPVIGSAINGGGNVTF